MAYFITLKQGGQPIQVNLDRVQWCRIDVSPGAGGTSIHFSKEDKILVDEDLKTVARLCSETRSRPQG